MSERTEPASRAAPPRPRSVGVLVEPVPRGRPRLLATVEGEVLLGRDDACPVVFLSERVSRRHARLWCLGEGRFAIDDLRSLNGTYVNGRRVVGGVELQDGDHVQLADVQLAFHVRPATAVVPPAPRPPAAETGASRGTTEPMAPSVVGPPEWAEPWPAAAVPRSAATPARVLVALLLGVVATVAAGALGRAVGAGVVGALALAVPAAVVVPVLVLRRRRPLVVAVVAALAAALGVSGVTGADVVRGRSVLPWVGSGGTFVGASQLARLTGGCAAPAVALTPARGPRTSPLTVAVSCLAAGERVEVRAGSALVSTLTADGRGVAGGRLRLPAKLACPASRCELTVAGQTVGYQLSAR